MIGFGMAGAVILKACRNVPDVPRRAIRSVAARGTVRPGVWR